MPLPARDGVIYRFGAFELASGSGELRKNGLRLKLQDQPIRVLNLLLENAGEVVTRDQIQKRLWADDVHVDYENAINSAVRKLREVLVDTSENPRYVETLAKRGYRFIAPVSTAPTATVAPAELPPEVPIARKRAWFLPACALLALAAVGGAAIRFWPDRVGSGPPLHAEPLTSYPGFETAPSFSPDGNQVAFSWNGEKADNYDIYVKLIGSGRPLRLTTDPAPDGVPAWSPDGQSIAFLHGNADDVTVQLVPALGGPVREVARLGKTSIGALGGWSLDGRRLLIAWAPAMEVPSRLFWVSLDTGQKQPLTSPPLTTQGDWFCRISPDGKMVAFARMLSLANGGSIGDLYTLQLTSDFTSNGEPRRLTFDNVNIRQMAWTADSREIVFSSPRDGAAALWRIPASGSEKPKRVEIGENAAFPAISPRLNRLAYQQQVPADLNIWRLDLSSLALPVASFIASTRQDSSPRYSPDGKRIAFQSDRSGNAEIWVCDGEGSNAVQLTNRGHSSGSPHWSSDGGRIAFDSTVDGTWEIFEMSSRGGQPRQLTSGSVNVRPSWSHDGQWIYFASSRTGRYQVWKMPARGGTAVQLSVNGGNNPMESEDGTAIYYNSGNSIMKASPDGGGETRVLDGVQDNVTNMAVTPDGIYYRDTQLPLANVQFFSFQSGKTRLILKPERPSNEVSVSPDGHWLLYTQQDGRPGSDLMLVENFH